MCFFSCNIELGWFWWPGIQYSHLSTCSILQSVWYFVHDYITNTTPPPLPRPPPRPNSFASTDDISKELLAPYEAGWGRRLIWIKLDRRVDTALKVSRPFMLRWQGVCVLGGGRHGVAKEAYLKAGVYLRQGSEKKWTTKLVILQIRPVTSSLFPFHAGGGYIKWGLNAMAWPAERAAENKTRGLKSRS